MEQFMPGYPNLDNVGGCPGCKDWYGWELTPQPPDNVNGWIWIPGCFWVLF